MGRTPSAELLGTQLFKFHSALTVAPPAAQVITSPFTR